MSREHFLRIDTNTALQRARRIHETAERDKIKDHAQQRQLQELWANGASMLISLGEENPKNSNSFTTGPVAIQNDRVTSHLQLTGEFTRIYSDNKTSLPVSGSITLETIKHDDGETNAIPVFKVNVSEATGKPSMKDYTRHDEDHEGHTHTQENIKIFYHVLSLMQDSMVKPE